MKRNMPESSSRIRSQSWSWRELLFKLFLDAVTSNTPADRIIAAAFRREKKYGSADRRFISEVYFSLFRWWGWINQTTRHNLFDPAGSGEKAPPDGWTRQLSAACLLGLTESHPVAERWFQQALQTSFPASPGADLAACTTAVQQYFPEIDPAPEKLLPAWIQDQLPPDSPPFSALIQLMQQRPPLWLRLYHPERQNAIIDELKKNQIQALPLKSVAGTIKIPASRLNLNTLAAFRRGEFEVQDFSSQCIGLACAAIPGERWWDACAGAGGKSLQLATQMQNRGTVVASDIREWKLRDLKKRARRAGLHNIDPRPWNGKRPLSRRAGFDGILVDAPCSCSGTWRRNPDARWNTKAEEVTEITAIQANILKRVAPALRPGGRLVYATCSICLDENERVVEHFLQAHPDFQLDRFPHPLSGILTNGMLRVWFHEANSDAAFIARFIRR